MLNAIPFQMQIRAAFRTVSFLALIAIFAVLNHFKNDDEDLSAPMSRRLEGEESNMKGMFQIKADPIWLLAPYIIGVLYMFLALAIVCDEYFVPALEVMSGKHHLNLTPDISGATLMAAGGSAPELFTSFIGTFQESEVGFGTIVGSAVFNVLFVVGMCSLLSKEVLQLTWWPLFRDSTYYAIGLLVLAIFVGVKGPGEIDFVEALILFLMYFGYIAVMGFNERLYKMITGKDLYEVQEEEKALVNTGPLNFNRPTTFRAGLLTLINDPRAGLLTLINDPDFWYDKARISFVSKLSGNVDDVFEHVDTNGDGRLTREEIQAFFVEMEGSIPETELDAIMKAIDCNEDGRVRRYHPYCIAMYYTLH